MGLFERIFGRKATQEVSAEGEPVVADPEPVIAPRPHDVDLTPRGLVIDGKLFETASLEPVIEVLGTPRIAGSGNAQTSIWEADGICAFTVPAGARAFEILLASDPETDRALRVREPRIPLSGRFTVEGRDPLDAIADHGEVPPSPLYLLLQLGEWTAEFYFRHNVYVATNHPPVRDLALLVSRVREHPDPFHKVVLTHRPHREPSGRWIHQPVDEETVRFDTPELAYAVIQHLMFERGLLAPRFDAEDFLADRGEDPYAFGGEIIPAVDEWFRELPIPAALAAQIERIRIDPEAEIYRHLAPLWEGGDGAFELTSVTAAELAQLPNLRVVEDPEGLVGPGAIAVFRGAGVEVI